MTSRYASHLLVFGGLLVLSVPVTAQDVVATLAVGQHPIRVAVNTLTNRIYLTNWVDGTCSGVTSTLTAVDGVSHDVDVILPGACHPWGLAVDEALDRVVVANFVDVRVVDGVTHAVLAEFNGGSNENSAAIDPSLHRLYVGSNNCISPRVNVFDSEDYGFIAAVPLDGMPLHLAVNSVTHQVYVTKQYRCPNGGATQIASTTLTVIDGTTNADVQDIPLDAGLQGVAVDETTNRIYVANPTRSELAVIDGFTNVVQAHVPVADSPRGVAVNPATGHVYVTNYGSSSVTAIDDVSGCHPRRQVGLHPEAVAINPVTGRVYVVNSDSGTLSVIEDPASEFACESVAPSWPPGSALTASNIGLDRLTLAWTPASDDAGVVRYDLFQDGTPRATVGGGILNYTVTGLASCTAYTFRVEACDADEACSSGGPSLAASTLTPAEALDLLAGRVEALAALGALGSGQAAGLLATLQVAGRHLSEGRVDLALTLLDAFVRQVTALESAGHLATGQAQILIGAVSAIQAHPTCAT